MPARLPAATRATPGASTTCARRVVSAFDSGSASHCHLENNLGDAEAWYVDLATARATWEQAIAFSVERGLIGPAMWQRGERLRCLYHGGEWDAALTESTEVLTWELETRPGPLEVYARLPMAGIAVHRGDLQAAKAHVSALVAAARRSGDPQVLFPGLSMAALVASAAGDGPSALGYLEELELETRHQSAWRSYCRVEPLRVAVALMRMISARHSSARRRPTPAGTHAPTRQHERPSPRRGETMRRLAIATERQPRSGASTAVRSNAGMRFSDSAGAAVPTRRRG